MPRINTPDQNTLPPTHEDFHWIFNPGDNARFADFTELTRDISAGVCSSLQILYTSELVREMNLDAEAGQQSAPAIGKTDAANLLRLSMAATRLLRAACDEHIAWFNRRHQP